MNAIGIAEICGAAFITGFSKSGVPGIGILIPTLAAMAMPARASTGFILPILVGGDCIAVGYWRRRAAWARLLRVLPWTALGVVVGYFLMLAMSDAAFKPLLGAIIIAVVALDLVRRAAKVDLRVDSHVLAAVTGILAGIFTMLANAAAPLMTIYLLSMGLPKEEFIGTGAWFYFIINIFKIPFSAALGLITWSTLGLGLVFLPLVVAGSFVGIIVMKRIPQKAFNILAQVLAVAGGIRLFF